MLSVSRLFLVRWVRCVLVVDGDSFVIIVSLLVGCVLLFISIYSIVVWLGLVISVLMWFRFGKWWLF